MTLAVMAPNYRIARTIDKSTLLATIDDDVYEVIENRLEERECDDTDSWIDLWADGHIRQYKLLGADRREYPVMLPKARESDVIRAQADYAQRLYWIADHDTCDMVAAKQRPRTMATDRVLNTLLRPVSLGYADICASVTPKIMRAFINEHGIISPHAEHLPAIYNKVKQVTDNTRKVAPYTLVVSIKPMAYLGLGHYACDKGSCFNANSDYGQSHSPVVIGAGSDSVVFFLKDKDGKTVARAWGTYTDNGVYVQNRYPREKSEIVRAINLALGGELMPRSTNTPDGIYDNGDAMAFGKPAIIGSEAYDNGLIDEPGELCGDCDERFPADDMVYIEAVGHSVCECCRESYTYDDQAEEYIHDCDAVYVEESGITTHCDNPDLHQSREGTWFLV